MPLEIYNIWGNSDPEWSSSNIANNWGDVPAWVANGTGREASTGGPENRAYRWEYGRVNTVSSSSCRGIDLSLKDLSTIAVGVWMKYEKTDHTNAIALRFADETWLLFGPTDDNIHKMGAWTHNGDEVVPSTNPTNLFEGTLSVGDKDEWHFYEMVWTRAEGNWIIDIYVDDAIAASGEVADPTNGATLSGAVDIFWNTWSSSFAPEVHKHGGYAASERVGPCFVQDVRPSADGFHSDWTGLRTDVDNTTVSSESITGQPGDKVTYEFEDFAPISGTVIAVQFDYVAGRSNDTDMVPLMRRGGVDMDGPAFENLPTGNTTFSRAISLVDPFTAQYYSLADLNATEFGIHAINPT